MTSQTFTLPCLLELAFTPRTSSVGSKFSSLVEIRAQFDTKNVAVCGSAGESARKPTLHLENDRDRWLREWNHTSPLSASLCGRFQPGGLPVGPTLRVSKGRNCHPSAIKLKVCQRWRAVVFDLYCLVKWKKMHTYTQLCKTAVNTFFQSFIWKFPLNPDESCITGTNSTFFTVSNVNIETPHCLLSTDDARVNFSIHLHNYCRIKMW